MAVVGINYTEGKPETYKSVRISYNFNKDEKIFDSGDFVKDWYDCNKFIIHMDTQEFAFSNSSSVDHFIMDGAPFVSRYLKVDKERKPYLSDDPYSDNHMDGMEYFVKEGTKPTWEELRELCDDKPKEK